MDKAPGDIPVEATRPSEGSEPQDNADGRPIVPRDDAGDDGPDSATKPDPNSPGPIIPRSDVVAGGHETTPTDGDASAHRRDVMAPEPHVPHGDDGDDGPNPSAIPEIDHLDPLDPARVPKAPVAHGDTPARNALPRIEAVDPGRRVDPEAIRVAAGGKLIVPREDIGADIVDDAELDLAGLMAQKVRKPGRREWIALNPDSEMTTRLFIHKPKADGIEVEHYYVDPRLRTSIRDELKDVRVFGYYSFAAKSHAIWIVNVTIDNSWYESLVPLFQQSAGFLVENAIRVLSDKDGARYRIRHKPIPGPVTWPAKPTAELLGEALGPDRFITSPDHPIYRDLIEGVELS